MEERVGLQSRAAWTLSYVICVTLAFMSPSLLHSERMGTITRPLGCCEVSIYQRL